MRNAKIKGRADGYKLGWDHGLYLSRCETNMKQISLPEAQYWDLKVLYVQEGLFILNKGIIDNLRGIVRKLIIANTTDPIVEMALQHRPDLILILNGVHGFDVSLVPVLRTNGFKTAVWFADDPYFIDKTKEYALLYDYVFTHELGCVSYYRELGCSQVFYLPLAVNPYQFRPQRVDLSYRSDICFVGTGFPNRIRFFNQISSYLVGKKVMIIGGHWNLLNDYSQLAGQIRLEGTLESEKYYNGAKIVINLHRSVAEELNSLNKQALSINPRTYEICACGSLQLTDIRQDLTDLYTPGVDLVTYNKPEELITKLNYYLTNEEERERIALQGLKTTIQRHTFSKRFLILFRSIFGEGTQVGGGKAL
jgi:spore maturation protein CgeB